MEQQLSAFLSSQMPEATEIRVRNLERRPGGASRENWSFDVSWQENGSAVERKCVLRRDPARSLLETDRSLEFRILRAMESTPVPAPRPYWLDAEGRWLEKPSLIMERVSGQATQIPTYPAGADPVVREQLAGQFVEILADIHRADWQAKGLAFLGVPRDGADAAARQVALWEATYRKDRLEPVPILEEAIHWLKRNLPAADRITLVHADYRSGNYLYDLYDAAGRITAILDWEMAHLGDPMEDLGWACMKFWSGGGLAVGLMPRDELIRRYERHSGIPVNERSVFFYEVLGNVKMAVISITGVRAFCDGMTTHMVLGIVGFNVPRLLADLVRQIGI